MEKVGDVISLVEELLHINAYEAAREINNVLNLGVNFTRNSSRIEIERNKYKMNLVEQFRKWENETFQSLCDYLHLLWHLEEEYKPINSDEEINNLYVEALQENDKIQYYIDLFTDGTDEDKIWFWKNQKEVISKINNKLYVIKERRKNE